ncbi:MAG TPA: TetR/AcrR family transcriptional regulator [Chitinophagaceae bacterium]|nr:TetR/AcrR family transcriptional regulator [Chitinophagaceae bacterium]
MRPIMIENGKDTRYRISSKAQELIMKYGIRTVSMDDIANAVGISKKTIYQYYADKDELVDAIVESMLSENQGACLACHSNAPDAVMEVLRAKQMIREMFRDMNPTVLYDMQKYHPKAFNRFLKHKNDFLYSLIKENLEKGIAQELYRPDINVEIITRFRVESMMMPFSPDFFSKQKHSLIDVEEQLLEHFLFGIVTLKGHKLILKYKQESEKNASKYETVSKAK